MKKKEFKSNFVININMDFEMGKWVVMNGGGFQSKKLSKCYLSSVRQQNFHWQCLNSI